MNFLKLTRQSVFQFVVMALVAFGFFAVLPLQAAQAQQTITVPCSGEIETPEGGLRATSDGNTWEFAIVPGEHTQIYDQQWLFNGLSPNSPNVEQGWGQFGGGGDGANAFSWVSPTQGGSYSIKVKAKRRCTLPGGEGGGNGPAADPNFEIEWDVDVQASKVWSTGAALTATMAAPAANASVAPGVPVTVSVAASDSDHWIKGVEAGDEADELIYRWSASGGFISGSGSSVSWTPPNATGVYTITCEVNDMPKDISSIDTGTRDDEPKITATVSLAVPPRTWSAGAGIGAVLSDKGQPVLKDGVALQNGRLVSPSNQTVPKPVGQENYPTIKVRPGKELRCTVESASDWDHWMRAGVGAETDDNDGTVHDDEEDEVKYTWSAGVGSFKDGKNTGTSVTWIAPKVGDAGFNPANEYTVTCAIDDTPKVVTAPDVPLGNTARDDASIERNFKVKVVDDTSWMELGLYKDQSANPQPALATIGGEIYIAVDVQIGGDTKITAPGAIYLRLSEHDGMNLHNATDNHAYVLVSQTGWNEWNFAGNSWGTDPISIPSSNTANTPRRFRKWIAWNTTAPIDNGIDPDGDGVLLQAGKLWGHNASHTVELEYVADNAIKHEMEFRPNDEVDPARKSGPNLIGADVKNLVIMQANASDGSEDYLRSSPMSEDPHLSHPTVSVNFDDGDYQEGDQYKYEIYFVETGGDSEVKVTSGIVPAGPPSIFTCTAPSLPWGVYGFDVKLSKWRHDISIDTQLLRSEWTSFEQTKFQQDSDDVFRFYYLIKSKSVGLDNLSSIKVDEISPRLKINIESSRLTDPEHTSLDAMHSVEVIDISNNEGSEPIAGRARIIATGIDAEASRYRNHKNKRLLPLNSSKATYIIYSMTGPSMGDPMTDWGGLEKYTWRRNSSTGFQTRLPGSGASVLVTSFDPKIQNLKPQDIWQWLVQKSNNARTSGRNYRFINTWSHGSDYGIILSNAAGTDGFNRYKKNGGSGAGLYSDKDGTALNDSTVGEKDWFIGNGDQLLGVANWNLMGCQTGRANDSISKYLVSDMKVKNGIGYKRKLLYQPNAAIFRSNQVWYNCVHRVGLKEGNNSTAQLSLTRALQAYNAVVQEWEADNNGKKLMNYNFDSWIVASPGYPIIDSR